MKGVIRKRIYKSSGNELYFSSRIKSVDSMSLFFGFSRTIIFSVCPLRSMSFHGSNYDLTMAPSFMRQTFNNLKFKTQHLDDTVHVLNQ